MTEMSGHRPFPHREYLSLRITSHRAHPCRKTPWRDHALSFPAFLFYFIPPVSPCLPKSLGVDGLAEKSPSRRKTFERMKSASQNFLLEQIVPPLFLLTTSPPSMLRTPSASSSFHRWACLGRRPSPPPTHSRKFRLHLTSARAQALGASFCMFRPVAAQLPSRGKEYSA